MNNKEEKLFNEAKSFKDSHADLNDVELFFEFNTIKKLDNYPQEDWAFIVKRIVKIFSCEKEGLCSIILYDLLESQKITCKEWSNIFQSLQQVWRIRGDE